MLSSATPQVSPERLIQFTFGFAPPLMIETGLRYGVFDILDKGAKSLEALCVETRTSPRGLRIILDALVGLDVLTKDDVGHYALTVESATFLVTCKPTYHGAFFLLTKEPMLSAWSKLDEAVRSGRPAHHINREQEGTSFFLNVWSVAIAQQSPQIRVTLLIGLGSSQLQRKLPLATVWRTDTRSLLVTCMTEFRSRPYNRDARAHSSQ